MNYKVYLPITLIIDGEVLWDNLENCGFDEKWLQKQLHINKIDTIKDIMYAEWKKDDGIYIMPYKNNLK